MKRGQYHLFNQDRPVGAPLPSLSDFAEEVHGHRTSIKAIVIGHNNNTLLTASDDYSLRLYSVTSGECLHSYVGHEGSVIDVDVLPGDRMVSVGKDNMLRLWEISSGHLFHTLSLDAQPFAVTTVTSDQIVVGIFGGVLQIFQINAEKSRSVINPKPLRVFGNDKLRHRPFHNISISAGTIAAGSLSRLAPVWNLSSGKRLLELVGPNKAEVRFVYLGTRVIATASTDAHICLYDSVTYKLIRNITTHSRPVYCVQLAGDERCVLSCSKDKTVAVHDTGSGKLLWHVHTDRYIPRCLQVVESRIAVGTESGVLLIVTPPENVRSKLTSQPGLMTERNLGVLQKALFSVLTQDSAPLEYCQSLITKENCGTSLEEWYSAHQLLVLAVKDGDIECSTTQYGRVCWWFDQLYVNVKNFDITTEHDRNLVKACLKQAKEMGLIEGVEPAFGAWIVSQDVRTEVQILHQAGIELFSRLLSVNNRLELLRVSFDRYRSVDRYSVLIGIVVQLIPIVGGSLAGILSAGAEVLEGLSVKDVVDYSLGLGLSVQDMAQDTWSDRLLSLMTKALSPEEMNRMRDEDKRRLEEVVSFCGLSVPELGKMLSERHQIREVEAVAEEQSHNDDENRDSTASSENRNMYLTDVLQVTAGLHGPDEGSNSPSVRALLSLDPILPSAFSLVPLSRMYINELDHIGLAAVWAAFVSRYKDENVATFASFRESLEKILEDNDLHGDVFVDASVLSTDKVVDCGVRALNAAQGLRPTLGLQAKVRQFVQVVRQR